MTDLSYFKKKNLKQLQGYKNVVSVGIGKKITKGKDTGEYAIVVGVRYKVPLDQLAEEDIIPTDVEEVKTDVVAVGTISINPPIKAQGLERVSRVRPAKPGYSIGNVDISAGTLGCLVYRGNETFLLSNAHVFTPDATEPVAASKQIVQPGPYDGGSVPDDLVGLLEEYVQVKPIFSLSDCPLSKSVTRTLTNTARKFRRQSRFFAFAESEDTNLVDAAIAHPTAEVSDEIEGLGHIAGPDVFALLGKDVQKSGRTTGVTSGKISQIDVSINVSYGFDWIIPKIAAFEQQILIESPNQFSQGGDSGSVIFAPNSQVCGLLFAGNEGGTTTIANQIDNVLSALNCTLLP